MQMEAIKGSISTCLKGHSSMIASKSSKSGHSPSPVPLTNLHHLSPLQLHAKSFNATSWCESRIRNCTGETPDQQAAPNHQPQQ